MRALITLMFFTCFFLQCNTVFTQDEKTGQKWYCYEETVLPEKQNEYIEMALELVELCKDNDFPYTFHTWMTEDFKYQLYSPINSLDDIDKINQAWKKIMDNWGREKAEKLSKTKISNFSSTFVMSPELTFEPQEVRLENNEVKLCVWKEYYLQPEKLEEATEITKKARQELVSMNYEDGVYYAFGGLGYEDPCLISWSMYKDQRDELDQSDKFADMASDDLLKLMSDFIPCIRTTKTKHLLYIDKLSYAKE